MKRLSCLLATLFALSVALPAFAGSATAEKPTLRIATLDGKTFDLAGHRGRWVVVNFWATWCAPCIKEMPDISAFVDAHKDVAAIGIAWEDTERAEVDAFVKAHKVSYPLAQGDIYNPLEDFEEPRGLPLTFLIAPDGRVARKFTGPITGADLEKAMAAKAAK